MGYKPTEDECSDIVRVGKSFSGKNLVRTGLLVWNGHYWVAGPVKVAWNQLAISRNRRDLLIARFLVSGVDVSTGL